MFQEQEQKVQVIILLDLLFHPLYRGVALDDYVSRQAAYIIDKRGQNTNNAREL